MEKRKLRLNLSKLLDSKLFVKILAVVLAVALWFTLSIAVYPNVEKRISGIPLSVSLSGGAAEGTNLIAQNSDNITVSANISGARYVIGDYTSDNLIASVDTTGVTKSGEYTLDVNVSSANSEAIEVLSVSPKTVTLSFDFNINKVLEITSDRVDTSSLATEDGFVKDIPVISPSNINIEGAKTIVDSISFASVKVRDRADGLTESFTTTNTEIVLYDSEGNEISKDGLTISPESISVSVNVTKKDSAPVYVNFKNSQGEDASGIFDSSVIVSTISPQAINVSAIGNVERDLSINLDLNLRDVSPGATATISKSAINAALSEKGLTASDGEVNTVYVNYKDAGFSSKKITVPKSAVKLQNIPDNKNVSIVTDEIKNVIIYGQSEVLDNLSDDDFIAVLDLSKAELSNDTFLVTVYCPDNKSVWAYGDYKITLSISDKE